MTARRSENGTLRREAWQSCSRDNGLATASSTKSSADCRKAYSVNIVDRLAECTDAFMMMCIKDFMLQAEL